MPTYIIFRRDNGEVVHVHSEPEELSTSPEDVLAHLDAEHDRESVEVMAIEPTLLTEGVPHRVDLESRAVHPVEDGGSFGGASASTSVRAARLPRVVRTVYKPERDQPGAEQQ
jgi:hypothetical protein